MDERQACFGIFANRFSINATNDGFFLYFLSVLLARARQQNSNYKVVYNNGQFFEKATGDFSRDGIFVSMFTLCFIAIHRNEVLIDITGARLVHILRTTRVCACKIMINSTCNSMNLSLDVGDMRVNAGWMSVKRVWYIC